ncbi:MAG: hypothetical protein RQ824_01220 [bacterium]|nr:hypothetical protein [bacterium]
MIRAGYFFFRASRKIFSSSQCGQPLPRKKTTVTVFPFSGSSAAEGAARGSRRQASAKTIMTARRIFKIFILPPVGMQGQVACLYS